MLDRLKNLNKDVAFHDVSSPKFSEYGRVINTIDATEIIAEARKMKNPGELCHKEGITSLNAHEEFRYTHTITVLP